LGRNLSMFARFKKLFASRSDQSAFRPSLTVAECFELANAETYTRSHGFIQNRAHRFFSTENRIPLVAELLSNRFGLTEFQYIGCGDNAVVVRYAEYQALRFRAPALEEEVNTQRVLQSPFICPIWREIDFHSARLNFVPYIPSLAVALSREVISPEAAEGYMIVLLRAGFENKPPLWFYDYKHFAFKFEQVGLLRDGTPIIIDQGSVILESHTPKSRLGRLAEDRRTCLHPLSLTTPWDRSWKDNSGQSKIDKLPKPDDRIISS
jgi:hypothetical protein